MEGDKLSHHQNSTDAFECVHTLWPVESTSQGPVQSYLQEKKGRDGAVWLAAPRKSRKRQKRSKGGGPAAVSAGQVHMRQGVTAGTAQTWLAENTAHFNVAQQQILQLHINRVFVEHQDEAAGRRDGDSPLLLLVHGRPGTGKSAVILMLRRFFVEVLQWHSGQEFVVAALQASVASMLGGETLHHVAGINPFYGQGNVQGGQAEKQKEVSDRLSLLRFLILDEIFMISANFLGEAEQGIRSKVAQQNFFRTDAGGAVRSWGGLNVTMFGDAWQIDPPEGIPLYSVPHRKLTRPSRKAALPLATQGLDLVWNREVRLVELTEMYRCQDEWWAEAGVWKLCLPCWIKGMGRGCRV